MRGIVVGYDGSQGSERALRWALREGCIRQAPVRVVQAWWYVPWEHDAGSLAPIPETIVRDIELARRKVADRLEQEVREIQRQEDAQGIDVHTELSEAPATDALLEASSGADLLVVGSRGHGEFVGLLLGSVGRGCVHRATCPVVVVPPAIREGTEDDEPVDDLVPAG